MTDSRPDIEGQMAENTRVRASYQFGEARMEVEGPAEFVNLHTVFFLSLLNNDDEGRNLLQLISRSNALISKHSASSELAGIENNAKPADLLVFFQKCNPQTQIDQILVITYYYQKYEGFERMVLNDYKSAYELLIRLAVTTPKNIDSSVRAVCKRTNFLFVQKGEFRLTIPGEKHIEAMIQVED